MFARNTFAMSLTLYVSLPFSTIRMCWDATYMHPHARRERSNLCTHVRTLVRLCAHLTFDK